MSLVLEDTLKLEEIFVEGYEKVIKATDEKTGLNSIISIHDTTLGPTIGGTRIYPYGSFDDALTDVLRLSKGMTYKAAASDCGLGGAKSVIILDPKKGKTEEMLVSFGRAVDKLNGLYTCAEDVGCNVNDVNVISRATRYVTGLPHEKSSGNPSYFTAWGVYRGIQAGLNKIFGSPSVKDKKIAIQGVGSVGGILADILFWNGAKLFVTDLSEDRAKEIAKKYSATYCSPDEIWKVECDVFSPCALGGVLNSSTIPVLKSKIVAGAANNQLLTEKDGEELMKKGVLYAPDYVTNAGGLINVADEVSLEGYNPENARNKVDRLYDQLTTIFEIADQNSCSTNQAANSLVEYRLKYKIGKRTDQLHYHHFQ
jgi:leucine dehydrogenase